MIESINVMSIKPSFKPSWIDRFNDWVKELPLSAWLFYLIFGLVLVGVQLLFLRIEGGQQDSEILPVIIFNGLFTPFLLALIYLLDDQAVAALNSMRPVLDTTESEFEQVRYMLSNMPSRASLIAGLTMMILAILMERFWIEPVRYAALGQVRTLGQLPIFAILFNIIDKSSAFLFGAFIYHTIRQLRLINTINMTHIHINLHNLGPLQAFSRLTASTAVGLVVGVYGWLLINPDLLADPLIFGFVGLTTILAVALFALPLFGVHRLMKKEKERMLHALDLDFETVFSKFNKGFRDNDYSATEQLHGTIAGLEIQQNRIMAIPTWPWRPETAQFILAALALPMVLMILRFLVEQAFTW